MGAGVAGKDGRDSKDCKDSRDGQGRRHGVGRQWGWSDALPARAYFWGQLEQELLDVREHGVSRAGVVGADGGHFPAFDGGDYFELRREIAKDDDSNGGVEV